MDRFQNDYDVWEKPDKMSTYFMTPLEWNFRKCKLIYCDRKWNSGFLERIKARGNGVYYKGSEEIWGCDEYVDCPACVDAFTGIYMCKNSPHCTLYKGTVYCMSLILQ